MKSGYFRFPTVFADQIVFVSEDDLWNVPLFGGEARRLTSGLGAASLPVFSRDGRQLAFASEEEGHREIYLMNAQGGEAQRLTYLGASSHPVAWMDEKRLVIRSNAHHPHAVEELFLLSIETKTLEPLRLGPAVWAAFSQTGEVAVERNANRSDPAHWKRYRGGTAGVIWIAAGLDQAFRPLLQLKSNLSRPMFVQDRVYFLSDHEGIGNIYSCQKNSQDLRRHTRFQDYYCRNAQTDGQHIVFHAGAEIFSLNCGTDEVKRVAMDYRSSRTQRHRRFVSGARHFESYNLGPKGDQVQITARGQVFAFKNWEGPVYRYGTQLETRYRLATWLGDEKRLAVVSDAGGADQIEIYPLDTPQNCEQTIRGDFGRITYIRSSRWGAWIAVTNHRNELILVDGATGSIQVIDRCEHAHLDHCEWSPDGRFIAYRKTQSPTTSYLMIYSLEHKQSFQVTQPLLHDFAPSWDPDGRYLYFLSTRILDPVYDNVQFELSFPRGVIPCLVTLRKNLPSPFLVCERSEDKTEAKGTDEKKSDKKEVKPLQVDFEGLSERVMAFPVNDGRYLSIKGLTGNKVVWSLAPIKGALRHSWLPAEPEAENRLEIFDLETRKTEVLMANVSSFDTNRERTYVAARVGRDLRVVKVGEKVEDKEPRTVCSKKSGWVDFERIRLMVEPAHEWRQMLKEVWRLQRDHFWDVAMGKLNWDAVLPRYFALVDQVNTRSEFSDLVWELQGELGTSHAYDIGGDYRASPQYGVGKLGAEFCWDEKNAAYRLTTLLKGDTWKWDEGSPLAQPGINAQIGDLLMGVNGEPVKADVPLGQMLMARVEDEIELNLKGRDGERQVRVRTLRTEFYARYRDWVEANRAHVAQMTGSRVGYLHIPNMGPRGFAEFHRLFIQEFDRDALIVDVRFNGGGHVSQLLLEKLARKRLGVNQGRWLGESPEPTESPAGPLVAITNEYAGSDGDIFSHTFKMRGLGPLIGKRTWGGVIGIWPRHALVDGSVTTQPEYACWYADVGWGLENHGVDPTIEVEYAPHDYRQNRDPQLARAITEALNSLKVKPAFRPKLVIDSDMRPPELT